jgi:hypothetical protein
MGLAGEDNRMAWITARDTFAETWRVLMEYANADFARSALAKLHGEPKTKHDKRNYDKQARQLRVALLQAREYFDAANSTSLVTSPNHLYYGMVCLASSIMLLRGDGTKSFDALRRDKKNMQHGLRFTTGATESTCKTELTILSTSKIEIRPGGHFINWYSALPKGTGSYGLLKRTFHDGTVNSNRAMLGIEKLPPPEDMSGLSFSALDLLQVMPDLHHVLGRYGASIPSSRITHERSLQHNTETPPKVLSTTNRWRIHGASNAEALNGILARFTPKVPYPDKFKIQSNEEASSAIVQLVTTEDEFHYEYPSIREDLSLESYAYVREVRAPEFVDAYLISFALSMLSRYYPDVWIACLESHCLATKIIERFVDVMAEKAPLLAGRSMLDDDLVITPHRPPWYA